MEAYLYQALIAASVFESSFKGLNQFHIKVYLALLNSVYQTWLG